MTSIPSLGPVSRALFVASFMLLAGCAISHRVDDGSAPAPATPATTLGPFALELPRDALLKVHIARGSAITFWLVARGGMDGGTGAITARVTWTDDEGVVLAMDAPIAQVDEVAGEDGARRIRFLGSVDRFPAQVPACASGSMAAQTLDLTFELGGERIEHRVESTVLECVNTL
jgi:hypothetical protein